MCVQLALLAVEHENEKHSLVIFVSLHLYTCACVRLQVHCLCVLVCVCIASRSEEETCRLHESLNRMSGMCKNTMKEPETDSCRMLPLFMVTLNVAHKALDSTCGGGRLVINHTSQQNPREMPLFLVPA